MSTLEYKINSCARNFLQLQVGVFVVNLGCWNVNKMRIRKLQGIVLSGLVQQVDTHLYYTLREEKQTTASHK